MGKRNRHPISQEDTGKRPQRFRPGLFELNNRGFTLPGYNYLGPGNDLNRGTPTDPDDYIAQDHDYDYRDIEDAGENPYTTYSEADEVARQRFGYGYGGNLGKVAFTKKRLLAEAGIIGKTKTKKRHHFMLKQQSDPKHHFTTAIANPDQKLPAKPLDVKNSKPAPKIPEGGTTPGQRANQPNQGRPGTHY